jgi:hypothetical protein
MASGLPQHTQAMVGRPGVVVVVVVLYCYYYYSHMDIMDIMDRMHNILHHGS